MARETKLGIALMVLLVGVFGFMVYKKWNSRQPTALAAAAESTSSEHQKKEQPTEPEPTPQPESESERIVVAADTKQREAAARKNPFGGLAVTSLPPQQAEPTAAEERFVRSSDASEASQQVPTATEIATEPFAESETSALETEPVFADASAPLAQASEPLTADADSVDAAMAIQVSPSDESTTSSSPDPFATASTTATLTASPATGEIEDTTDAASASLDDPFAETGDSAEPTVARTAPESPFGGVAASDPASGGAVSSESASGSTTSPAFDESLEISNQGNVATTPTETNVDPFAGAQSTPAADAQGGTEPGRLFADAEATDGFSEAESLDPATSADALPAGIPSSETTSQTAAASHEMRPVATQGQSYVVVGENDSYWALSKRVYGTPAYFHALAKYNATRIKDPNRLKAGMKVLTPEPHQLESLFPHLISRTALGKTTTEGRSGLSWDAQGVPFYQVGESDTLTGIAQAHLGRASRWVQIYEMNRKVVADPKTLRPGTVLRLPADASRLRLVPQG